MDNLPVSDSLAPVIALQRNITNPDLEFETKLTGLGYRNIAGIDEAGRGPLAGPVVAAAVILNRSEIPNEINDSKKLSPGLRNELYQEIIVNSDVGIASVSAQTIDETNIRLATLSAMQMAVNALIQKPDYCLIDGREIPLEFSINASAVIKGDARSLSVSAASIVAKVTRDRMMVEASRNYKDYGFSSHKGYGTKAHLKIISQYGPCPLHRMSFAPIRDS